MTNIIYKKESYEIIGKCINMHNQLGAGLLEIVYKDAFENEYKMPRMHEYVLIRAKSWL